MHASEASLVNLASVMGLHPIHAVALPTAITNAAGKVGMSEDRFVAECHRIPELRDYVASACRKVA